MILLRPQDGIPSGLEHQLISLFIFITGNKTEFSNMFERPIQNGQCVDSTPRDVKLMMFRAHVLHSQLNVRTHHMFSQTLNVRFVIIF